MLTLLIFLYSFSVYSAFQFLDMISTHMAASKLDMEMHEVNPLLVTLKKRFGLKRGFVVMWILFAPTVGLLDTLFFFRTFGFWILCYVFGMFHFLAFINNLQIYFHAQIFGAKDVEENTRLLVQMLRKRSFSGKIILLIKLNLFKVVVAIYSLISLLLLSRLLESLTLTLTESISVFLLYMPPIMIFALIMFFPVDAFGTFLISIRRLKMSSGNEHDMTDGEGRNVSLPVNILEVALDSARAKGAKYVQFTLSKGSDTQDETEMQ